jgi:hypothetical protein
VANALNMRAHEMHIAGISRYENGLKDKIIVATNLD